MISLLLLLFFIIIYKSNFQTPVIVINIYSIFYGTNI